MKPRSESLTRTALWRSPSARWVLSLLLFVLLWQSIVSIFDVPGYLLPSPSSTMRAIVNDAPLLGRHAAATIVETLAGLGLALVLGVAVALTMHRSKVLRDLIYPHLVLSQAVPLIAIAPMILIWFGLGSLSKILVVAFVCFFPLTVNTYEGFRAVDPAYAELLETFGATWSVGTGTCTSRRRFRESSPARRSPRRTAFSAQSSASGSAARSGSAST